MRGKRTYSVARGRAIERLVSPKYFNRPLFNGLLAILYAFGRLILHRADSALAYSATSQPRFLQKAETLLACICTLELEGSEGN